MRHPAVSGVVGSFPIFAGLTRLVISPDEEYPIVRSGRERQGYEDTGSKSRKADNPVMAEQCNDSSDCRQFDPHHGQQEK